MGHKRSHQKMEELGLALVEGMMKNGIDEKAAGEIFDQLSAFADFGFAESHAASFALLVYISAYLKVYYPAEFTCSLLNAQPMGFYSPSSVVFVARRRGLRILPVDCTRSLWDCTVEGGAVRLGFRSIKKLGPRAKQQIERALEAGPFTSLADFVHRSALDRDVGAAGRRPRDRRRAGPAIGHQGPHPRRGDRTGRSQQGAARRGDNTVT
jgi:error-prone DNA polymerase